MQKQINSARRSPAAVQPSEHMLFGDRCGALQRISFVHR